MYSVCSIRLLILGEKGGGEVPDKATGRRLAIGIKTEELFNVGTENGILIKLLVKPKRLYSLILKDFYGYWKEILRMYIFVLCNHIWINL